MVTSNHALAGALVAATVPQPLLVLPLALLSHFVLDVIPHHGYNRQNYHEMFKHWGTYWMVAFDVVTGLLLIGFFLIHSLWLFLAALVAILPDVVWPYLYFYYERHNLHFIPGAITSFHKRIQWCERSWGSIVEVLFCALGFVLLRSFVRF